MSIFKCCESQRCEWVKNLFLQCCYVINTWMHKMNFAYSLLSCFLLVNVERPFSYISLSDKVLKRFAIPSSKKNTTKDSKFPIKKIKNTPWRWRMLKLIGPLSEVTSLPSLVFDCEFFIWCSCCQINEKIKEFLGWLFIFSIFTRSKKEKIANLQNSRF